MRIHRPHLPVTVFYLLITAAAFAVYHYLQGLPAAQGVISAASLWTTRANPLQGLATVWFIFAWGFGVQSLIQITRVIRRRPRDANLTQLLKHGAYLSAHAGFFEEVVFRLYAFLSFIIILRYLDPLTHGTLQVSATHALLPAANFLTAGVFTSQFTGPDWALGVAVILGSLFFRSAHIHYGRLSKLNVWVIGLVMFWLTFHYGLPTAIAAHFLYDLCVFTAIAITAPLQPRPVNL